METRKKQNQNDKSSSSIDDILASLAKLHEIEDKQKRGEKKSKATSVTN